jgi:metallo-beta-lactamase family protein
MELKFFGAAGEVTGSCHIVRCEDRLILLDCGLIQGSPQSERRNVNPFPFDAKKIAAVVLSHAHIDHSGRIPLLVKRGYRGPIFTHNASRDLAKILLQDCGYLQERDAERENRHRKRKGLEEVEPLYTRADAQAVFPQLIGIPYGERREILPGVEVCLRDAGHILGSASIELWLREGNLQRKLVFSGDLGQYDTPILNDPAAITTADYVVMESTYGNRLHRDRAATIAELGEIILSARADRGNILIPAFAVGRSQEILYYLGRYAEQWNLADWHVFLDSPLAIEASKIYWDYPHLYDEDATRLRNKLHEMPHVRNLHLSVSSDDSRAINNINNGAIVLAGSGMCNGGRIVHHLKHNLWRRECHVAIVGFQAYGSLGRRLVEGQQRVRIHGETIRVAAAVHTIGGLSAHADQADLQRWYDSFHDRPALYLVHGEPDRAAVLSERLKNKLGARVFIAKPGLKIDIGRVQPLSGAT